MIAEESLAPAATKEFIGRALGEGRVQESGAAIITVLPPVSRFSAGDGHGEKKERVFTRLGEFVDRYFWLGGH